MKRCLRGLGTQFVVLITDLCRLRLFAHHACL